MLNLKAIGTAALLTLAAATANATTLDFTTQSTFSSITAAGASGTAFDTTTFTITTVPAGNLTFGEGQVGTTCPATLACEFDGLGVVNDEISTTEAFVQNIIVSFNSPVLVTGLHFLDLFVASGGGNLEDALVSVDGGAPINFMGVETPGGNKSGYLFAGGLELIGKVFTFSAAITNDNRGLADYALAGMEVAPIPLPAGLLLLGGALGALGISRRRKAA